jgi:hypothetical protein
MTNLLQNSPICNNLEEEWINITTTLKDAVKEGSSEKRKWTRKGGFIKWDGDTQKIIYGIREAFKKHISTSAIKDDKNTSKKFVAEI